MKEAIVSHLFVSVIVPLYLSLATGGVCYLVTRSVRRTFSSAAWLTSLLPVLAAFALYRTLPYYFDFFVVVTFTLELISIILLRILMAKGRFSYQSISSQPAGRFVFYFANAIFTMVLLGVALFILSSLTRVVHGEEYPWNPAQRNSERF